MPTGLGIAQRLSKFIFYWHLRPFKVFHDIPFEDAKIVLYACAFAEKSKIPCKTWNFNSTAQPAALFESSINAENARLHCSAVYVDSVLYVCALVNILALCIQAVVV